MVTQSIRSNLLMRFKKKEAVSFGGRGLFFGTQFYRGRKGGNFTWGNLLGVKLREEILQGQVSKRQLYGG